MLRHTENYYHFKKYSKATLMGMTKKDLVSHIECLYNNYENTDSLLCYQWELAKTFLIEHPEFDVKKFAEKYWEWWKNERS